MNRNAERDHENIACLVNAGWDVLVIWECETEVSGMLRELILDFMDNGGR